MSEPRKSRREPKLSQRFKDYLGEESSTVKCHTPSKAVKTPAKTETKAAAKKTSPVKAATPAKVTPVKPAQVIAASKATVKTGAVIKTVTAKTVVKSDTAGTSAPVKVSASPVTQNVRKTSIKEVKKVAAAAVKTKPEKSDNEILTTKRVPKPSAKIAEALETEAALAVIETPAKKMKLMPTAQTAVSPTSVSTKVVRGGGANSRGRGRGAGGQKRGALTIRGGRGRGRGASTAVSQLTKKKEDEEMDTRDCIRFMSDESSDDDELDEEEEEEDETLETSNEKNLQMPIEKKVVKQAQFGSPKKISVMVKSPNNLIKTTASAAAAIKPTGALTSIKAAANIAVPPKVMPPGRKYKPLDPSWIPKIVSLTGDGKAIGLIATKPVTLSGTAASKSSGDPQMSASMRKVLLSPSHQTTSEEEDDSKTPSPGKGVKRPMIKTQLMTQSSNAKKIKLVAAKDIETSKKAVTGASPIKLSKVMGGDEAVPIKTMASSPTVVRSAASEDAAANGVKSTKMDAAKTVGRTFTVAKAIKAAMLNKSPTSVSSSSGSDSDARRSRRQPKPTERMKEFLHREAEEAEDDVVPMHTDDSELDDLDEEEDDDMPIPGIEEANAHYLKLVQINAENRRKAAAEKAAAEKAAAQNLTGVASSNPALPFKTQVIRKLGQNTLVTTNKAGVQKVVQVKTGSYVPPTLFATGSKVTIKRPATVNGNQQAAGANVKTSTASVVVTGRRPAVKSNEAPIIIKVRTLTAEELESKQKKKEEQLQQITDKKAITIKTTTGLKRPVLMKPNRQSVGGSEESEGEEEAEEEEEIEYEDDDQEEEEATPQFINNKKIITLCNRSGAVLNNRASVFVEDRNAPGSLTMDTIQKFIVLTANVARAIKKTISEDGESLSDSENFEEYCQDVLDSVGDEVDMQGSEITEREAEQLLVWLRKPPPVKPKIRPDITDEIEGQQMFLTQVLELLTLASSENALNKFNASLENDDDDLDDYEDDELLGVDSDDDLAEEEDEDEEEGGEEREQGNDR